MRLPPPGKPMRLRHIIAGRAFGQMTGLTQPNAETKLAFAEYLRENQTPSERMMARVLFHLDIPAEPQVPIMGWIADFYDASTRTVIEVDGSVHDHKRAADDFRDERMRQAGYRVYRFRNEEVAHFLANIAETKDAA